MKVLEFISSEKELYDLRMKPVAERYGLTAMELSILLFLANNPEHDTATEIAEIRHLAKSHVSTSVRTLVEKGLMEKEHRDGNHRTTHLVLLPASEEIISAGQRSQTEFTSALTENFSEDELRQLEMFISRMNENVHRALQEGIRIGER